MKPFPVALSVFSVSIFSKAPPRGNNITGGGWSSERNLMTATMCHCRPAPVNPLHCVAVLLGMVFSDHNHGTKVVNKSVYKLVKAFQVAPGQAETSIRDDPQIKVAPGAFPCV